ncbi:hypothetical protein ACFXTH_017371 [Malus domestica]
MHEGNTIFSFEVGKGSVIKAWDFAVKTMKVGEIAKITCKPEYAYGSTGSPPDIPPECMLERIISSFWECKLCWISFSQLTFLSQRQQSSWGIAFDEGNSFSQQRA